MTAPTRAKSPPPLTLLDPPRGLPARFEDAAEAWTDAHLIELLALLNALDDGPGGRLRRGVLDVALYCLERAVPSVDRPSLARDDLGRDEVRDALATIKEASLTPAEEIGGALEVRLRDLIAWRGKVEAKYQSLSIEVSHERGRRAECLAAAFGSAAELALAPGDCPQTSNLLSGVALCSLQACHAAPLSADMVDFLRGTLSSNESTRLSDEIRRRVKPDLARFKAFSLFRTGRRRSIPDAMTESYQQRTQS